MAAFTQSEAVCRGWATPAGGVYYDARYGFYNVSFFEIGNRARAESARRIAPEPGAKSAMKRSVQQ